MAAMTRAERELESFARSLPNAILQCRARHQHRFPDWMDTRKTRAWKERSTGVVLLEADCENGCGTFVRKIVGPDGIMEYSRTGSYDYTDEYKLPKELREEFTVRDVLAAERTEMLRRRPAGTFTLVDDLVDVPRQARKSATTGSALAAASQAGTRSGRVS